MRRIKSLTSQNRRQVTSFWAMALSGAGGAAGIGGCSSGPQRAASHSATAEVSPSRPLRVTVPGVATVTAPAGSFRGRGTITVAPVRAVRASLPYGTSLSAAGTGIDVTFSGVTLMGVTGSVPRRTPAPCGAWVREGADYGPAAAGGGR